MIRHIILPNVPTEANAIEYWANACAERDSREAPVNALSVPTTVPRRVDVCLPKPWRECKIRASNERPMDALPTIFARTSIATKEITASVRRRSCMRHRGIRIIGSVVSVMRGTPDMIVVCEHVLVGMTH